MAWRLPFFGRKSAPVPRSFEETIARLDGGFGDALSALHVSPETALQVSSVLACVKVIADGCATPPLNLYRATDGAKGRQLATNIPEFRLLSRRPNEFQTSFEFRRQMTLHAALTGNALALKVKSANRVRELLPIPPGRWSVQRVGRYEIEYRVHDEFGVVGIFGPEDVFHLSNLHWDFVKGLPALRLARVAIGLAAAAEESQVSLHVNGGRASGVLSTTSTVTPEIIERLKQQWAQFSRQNRNGTAVLDNGFTWSPIVFNGVDSQHLETRKMQVEEICRAFGVFPIMIGHSDKTATFASSEAFFAAHLRHTLAPWHQLWIQRIDETVLDGSGPLFVEFDTRYLMQGAMKDAAVWARTMAEMGIYTRNEIRDFYGLDPLPGLDQPLTPKNMQDGKPDPAEPGDPEESDDETDA
ncbi:MAG: phage portal protein [Azospirillum sp.]|nr:phage portal protein [Azospirillum sp.]